ncbi:MAG TPA: TonB-dependent receptor plug domain-containing protein, partial [Flavitalea sp.]|nr:TonB-dependent receptor plug domain-containing protein [Flavitalea sp.]
MKKNAPLLLALFILLPALLLAQQRQIKGKITDEAGAPVPDVSVGLKGNPAQTRSAADGTFSITAPNGNVELVFTHVNYPEKTVMAPGDNVSVTLQQSSRQLDEVVVVGYGTQKKRDITGAVATFNADNLNERPVVRVDQALVGQMAGVRVKQTSGLPGRGFSIQIRGTGSISASNEPLYVIDGFPLEVSAQNSGGGFSIGNPLDNINPNDIESIQVLKDASAAAIYGSRASNGVVLITTKKGKSGKAKINFNTYVGYNERVRKIDMLSAEGWVDRAIEMINRDWVRSGTGRTADQTTAQRRAILGLPAGTYNVT